MKKFCFLFMFLFYMNTVISQGTTEISEVVFFIDNSCTFDFPDGPASFGKYLMKKLKTTKKIQQLIKDSIICVKFRVRSDGIIHQLLVNGKLNKRLKKDLKNEFALLPKFKPNNANCTSKGSWFTLTHELSYTIDSKQLNHAYSLEENGIYWLEYLTK